jgi:hypothetical protein
MINSASSAASWVSFLSRQSEVPFRSHLQAHFDAGTITRLCDCGCNSFDLNIPTDRMLPPLCPPRSHGGKFFELVCESTQGSEIAFLLFADDRGYLSGIDVTAGAANHEPLPDVITVSKVLYAL